MKSALASVRIAGVAAAVPQTVETILDGPYGTPEARSKFVASTGVKRRRRCLPSQFCSDLVEAAAERLLEELGWGRQEIGALVFITQTPDLYMPATACVLQHRLRLSSDCAAFDVNLGCSGYGYGLKIAGSLLSETGIQRALLLVGDAAAKNHLPSRDSKIPPLFGDAGSATALEWNRAAPPLHFELKTFGEEWRAIQELRPGGRPGIPVEKFQYETDPNGLVLIDTLFRMKGEDVFNFAVREAPASMQRLLEFAGRDFGSLDAVVLHQANRMINEFIRKRLKLEPEKVPSTLENYGNTSSATIPLTLVNALRSQLQTGKLELLLCGFGVGASIATVHCIADRIACPEIIEV